MKLPPLPGLLWIILLWALFYAAQGVHAEPPRVVPPAPRPDTRVVIDISGSMKKTDPQNLRVPATKLLLNLAQDKSRFGIWMFGQQVNNIVPVAEVSPAWKKKTASAVNAINSRGLFTNIGAALEAAASGETKPDPAWDRTIVLLSDGKVDISKDPKVNAREQTRILTKVVPRLKAAGFHIRTVALSDQADQEFLKSLALQTGGSFVLAKTADDLLHAFVDTSDKVNSPEQVPLVNNTFSIDPSVKEFTALIFRKSGMKKTRLVSPDGQEFSLEKGSPNVSWFADPRYDLVTVYNPAAGKWKVIADLDPDNRVTVVSDLQVNLAGLPDNVLEGEKVTMKMSLTEHGRVITNPNFLGLMDITFSQDTANGEHFEGKLSQGADGKPFVPDDGIYTAKLGRTLLKGEQTFTVLVDGKTFKRKKVKKVMVYRDVMSVTTAFRDDNGKVLQYLVAQPHPGMVNTEKLELVAQIQDPKGEKSIQNGVQQADGSWRIDVPPQGTLGDYQVLVKVKGTSINGEPFELVQGPYSVDYTPLGLDSGKTQNPAEKTQAADQQQAAAQTAPPPPPGDAVATKAPSATKDKESATPPVTFDDSAMNVPSLDVQELPPDDNTPAPAQEPSTAQADAPAVDQGAAAPVVAKTEVGSKKGSKNSWLLLGSIFILGNLAIVGVGLYFYLRFLRKTDIEQTRVVEEITELKQRHLDERGDPKPLSEAPEPAPASAFDAAPLAESELSLEEDATVMRPLESEPELDMPSGLDLEMPSAAIEEPAEAVMPEPDKESAYVNQAAPLDLEDDEMIEVDDDFDEELVEDDVDNLDDLDMMLSEQEEVGSDTEINQTIDQMLEQPTVFPDKKPKSEEDKEKDDSPRFADDEFMLDNPDTKKG